MNPEQSIAYLNTLTLAEPQPAVAAFDVPRAGMRWTNHRHRQPAKPAPAPAFRKPTDRLHVPP